MKPDAITVDDISKTFKLPHEKNSSLKSALINIGKRDKGYEIQQVLTDISFEIKQGEFFGIVGRNGSGKSTLLKLLAGIYTPDKGTITLNGKLTPFIELGVGFNPELTGRENVFLNGALLGFDRKEMDAMYNDIVSFAELERFMDQKLKNYSSGMQVRLAFSIAIRAQSDILLIDEVLAVGDVAFQQKCYDYFDRLKEEKQTIILVSHDMGAIKQFCDRALLLNKGEIMQVGDPADIARTYEQLNYETGPKPEKADAEAEEQEQIQVKVLDNKGNAPDGYEYGKELQFEVAWPKEIKAGIVGIVVYKAGEVLFATNTINQDVNLADGKIRLVLKTPLGDGHYKYSATVFGKNRRKVLGTTKPKNFLVYGQPVTGEHKEEWEGVTYLKNSWK